MKQLLFILVLCFGLCCRIALSAPSKPGIDKVNRTTQSKELKMLHTTTTRNAVIYIISMWPHAFDCPFTLNVPPSTNTPAIVNKPAHFYYQWTNLQASLIDYPAGCLPGLFPESWKTPCKFFFLPDNTYLYLPTAQACCLLFPGVGSIPPDFLTPFNYSGYQTLAFDMNMVTHLTDFWVSIDGFQYWTDATTGFDVQFSDASLLLWNFGDFNVTKQPSSLFKLPESPSVCNTACPGTSAKWNADVAFPHFRR